MNNPISIAFTGHSLGAWLAIITAFTSEYLELSGNDENKDADTNTNANTVKDEHNKETRKFGFISKIRELFPWKKEEEKNDGEENEQRETFQKFFSNDSWSHIHTVVFDSPGCYEKLCQISVASGYERYKIEAHYLIAALDITIYVNTPNVVNCVNSHKAVSRILQIYETRDGEESFRETIPKNVSWRSFETHEMLNFIRMLIRPRNTVILSVWDWPSYFFLVSNRKETSNVPVTFSGSNLKSLAGQILISFVVNKGENELMIFISDCPNIKENEQKNEATIHYNAKKIDRKSRSASIFTKKEYQFLNDWNKLKKEFSNLKNLKPFLKENQLETYDDFLPKFELSEDDNKKIFSCLETGKVGVDEVNRLINRTKQLLNLLPDVYEKMESDVKGIEGPTIEELLKDRSEKYINEQLPKWNVDFNDYLQLEDFLNSDHNENLKIVITNRDIKEQVFIIRNIIERMPIADACYRCYLSLADLNELNKKRDVVKVFKDQNCHAIDILVVDCTIGRNIVKPFDILDEMVLIAKNKLNFSKKLILVINEEIKEPESCKGKLHTSASFSFVNLTEQSKNYLLGKTIFYLYDKEINLKNIFNVFYANELSKDQKIFLSESLLCQLIKASGKIQINSGYATDNYDLKVSTYEINENIKITEFPDLWKIGENFGKDALFLISRGPIEDDLCEKNSTYEITESVKINEYLKTWGKNKNFGNYVLFLINKEPNVFTNERDSTYEVEGNIKRSNFLESWKNNEDFGKCVLFSISGDQTETYTNPNDLLSNEMAKDSLETFYELCRKNEEKRIYWLQYSSLQCSSNNFQLKQIYDKDFYMERRLYHEICFKKDFLEIINSNCDQSKSSHSSILIISNDEQNSVLEKFKHERIKSMAFVDDDAQAKEKSFDDKSVIIARNIETALTIFKNIGKRSAHLIRVHGERFIWVRSKGSIEDIYGHVYVSESTLTDVKFLSYTKDEDLQDHDTRAVVIADESGMGKSTLLLKLAKDMDNHWVIRVNLINFRKSLDQIPSEAKLSEDTIIDFLSISNSNLSMPLVKEMLKYSFLNKTSVPVVLLFDGFDEIPDENIRNALVSVFKYLKESTRVRIYITTKSWAKKILEEKLSVFAVRMKEISEEDQKNFIKKFWSSRSCLQTDVANLTNKLNAQVIELFRRKDLFVFKYPISSHDLARLENELNRQMQIVSKEDLILFLENQESVFQTVEKFQRNSVILKQQVQIYFETISLLNSKLVDLVSFFWSLNKAENLFCQNFLKNYYGNHVKVEKMIEILLISFEKMKEDMEDTLNRDVLGIPLQLRMLAIILQPHFNDKESFKFPKTLRELFQRFVTLKLEIYIKEKLNKVDFRMDAVEILLERHKCLAFQLLFPDDVTNILKPKEIFDLKGYVWKETVIDKNDKSFKSINNLWKDIAIDINQIGLVEVFFSGEYRFIHSTVAEFFATGKVLNLLKEANRSNSLENLLLNDILLKDEYKMIRQFLNDELEAESDTENLLNFLGSKISEFIDNKKFKNFCNEKGETCLHICVSENLVKLAKLLLNSFVKLENALSKFIDIMNIDHETAIHYAAFNDQLELAAKLICCKPKENILYFSVDQWEKYENLLPEENVIFDHVVISFSKCTISTFFRKNDKIVKTARYASNCSESHQILDLIKTYGDIKRLSSTSFNTLSLFARHINALEDLNEMVLKYRPELEIYEMNDKSIRGHPSSGNLLYLAAKKGEWDIFFRLLNENIELNSIDEASEETPLLAAARNCHWRIVKELINWGANVNNVDRNSTSVIYYAVLSNKLDIVVQLLENKADLNIVQGISNATALGTAALMDLWDIVEVLIRHEANVKITLGPYETTVLHYAAAAGKREIVLKLLEKGAIIDAIESNYGFTPLTIAANSEKWDVVRELIKHGANVDIPISGVQVTVLQLALVNEQFEQFDIVFELINKTENVDGYIDSDQNRPVMIAASRKYWRIFSKLVDRGADINTPNPKSGFTVLHLAALDGQLGIVKKLLNKNVNIDAIEYTDNVTPIYLAAHHNHWDVVLKLIESNANVNIPHKSFNTVLHLAAQKGELRVVKKLLENRADVNAETIHHFTPMCTAALQYNWDIVLELLNKGGNPNIPVTVNNETVLYIAAIQGQLNVVRRLVDKHANINAIEREERRTPIFAAAMTWQWGVVLELINLGADVNIPNIYSETVLHLAVSNGKLDVVKKLIIAGARVNVVEQNNQITPLGIAASKNYWDIVDELINNNADINVQVERLNGTFLHYVASAGKTELVERLLNMGAEINAVERSKGYTPLTIAARNQHWDTVILLIQRGADLNTEATKDGTHKITVLHFAAYYNGLDVVKKLLLCKELKIGEYEDRFSGTAATVAAQRNNWEIVFELVTNGANISKPVMDTSMTLLHFAAEKNQLNVIEKLLERKGEIDINARELSQMMTPIFMAALNSHWDAVTILIVNGADVNIPDLGFRTVLYLAAEKGKSDIVELLLTKQALVNTIESVKKASPIYIAALNGHWLVVSKLIEGGADVNILYSSNQISILHLAASSGQLKIVNALLDRYAEMDVAEKNDNVTPIYAAGLNEHWDVVKELIQRGARVNIPTKKDRKTIVNLAVDNSEGDIISEIDKVGANIFVES